MDSASSPALPASGVWARGPLFQELSASDLEVIAARTTARQFIAGDVLIRQDLWCGELFILRDGVAQVSVEKAEAPGEPPREVPIRRMVAGDILGEMSLLTGSPPSATVRAMTDGQALVLSQQDFLQLALELPRFSHNINAILSERLRHSNLQKVETQSQQIVVAIGSDASLWHQLARIVARLSRAGVLFVDLTGSEESQLTLADLLSGRINPGEATPGEKNITAVHGTGEDTGDLTSLLGRLGNEYRHVLIALPGNHPMASPQLLAYAGRAILAAPTSAMGGIRSEVEELSSRADRLDIGVVLTDAPSSVVPTVSTLEVLGGRAGAPVQAILPADPETMGVRIEALGRWLVGQRIGLALGAGGAKGWAHVGVLRSLHRAGVPIDCFTGVSIGAILSAGAALGRSEDWIEDALGRSISRIFRPAFPIHGVLTNRPLGRWLRKEVYGDALIEDTEIPLAISAADLSEGSEIVLRHGPIWQAVLASSAIPGLYPAVSLGRHFLVDGGVVNPVPVGTARLLGADIVIAVDLSVPLAPRRELDEEGSAPGRPPLIFTNILRSRDIMMSVIQAHSVANPSVLVKPSVEGISLRNFRRGSKFMTAGEEAMEEMLPALRQHLPWLGQKGA